MRLIDADAFKEHLASFVVGGEKTIKETTCGNEWIDGVHTAYREIDEMPTIDRPRGEWLTQWKDTCSQCKKEFDVPTGDNGKALWNYCPNCGADMREGDDE